MPTDEKEGDESGNRQGIALELGTEVVAEETLLEMDPDLCADDEEERAQQVGCPASLTACQGLSHVAPREIVGTPVPKGARRRAGNDGPASPLKSVDAVPEPSRLPTRTVPD